ncbi:MAG: hypothetical protein HQ536_01010 [Parcubacteria group bacterium]|nr:hypothetical protein [Parcubacteria group bacterium]
MSELDRKILKLALEVEKSLADDTDSEALKIKEAAAMLKKLSVIDLSPAGQAMETKRQRALVDLKVYTQQGG